MERKNRIWTVSSKGGVGTSTVCVNLARAFAAAGQRVLLVDLDTTSPSLDVLLGVDNAVYDVRDALLGRMSIKDAAVRLPSSPNMYLLCGTLDPAGDLPLTKLDSALCQAEKDLGISVVLLDTHSPGRYAKTIASIVSHTVLVTEPLPLPLYAAEKCGVFMREIDAPNLKMVVNRYDFTAKPVSLCSMIDQVGVPLLGVIAKDEDMAQAQLHGKMAKEGASHNTVCGFRNIAHRLFGQHCPLFSGFKKFDRKKFIG